MSCRYGQHIGEIVETAVSGFITRQQWPDIEVEVEEIVDGVTKLRAIQAMDWTGCAGIRMGAPGGVDVLLQGTRDLAVTGGIGSRTSGRGHGACPQLRNDSLPGFRVASRLRDVKLVQRKPCRLEF